jgi:hypothetical protein
MQWADFGTLDCLNDYLSCPRLPVHHLPLFALWIPTRASYAHSHWKVRFIGKCGDRSDCLRIWQTFPIHGRSGVLSS